jgi:hypothetical protein
MGVRVAIDVHPICESVFLRNQCRTLPVYEVGLDLSASLMRANLAVPLVASKINGETFGFSFHKAPLRSSALNSPVD